MSIWELLAYINLCRYASGVLLCHQINRIWFGTLMEPSWHAEMHIVENSAIGWASSLWQKEQHALGLDTAVLVQARRLLASLERYIPETYIGYLRVDATAALLMQVRCR